MVAVFMPVLKLTLGAASPDHQSHADLPAWIHDVSAIFDGGFRLRTMLDSISLPRLVADHEHAPRAVERRRGLHGHARRGFACLIHLRRQIRL